MSGNDITFSWEDIEGNVTRVEIQKCTSQSLCSVLHEFGLTSSGSVEISGEHSDGATYKLVIYQENEKIVEHYFDLKIQGEF